MERDTRGHYPDEERESGNEPRSAEHATLKLSAEPVEAAEGKADTDRKARPSEHTIQLPPRYGRSPDREQERRQRSRRAREEERPPAERPKPDRGGKATRRAGSTSSVADETIESVAGLRTHERTEDPEKGTKETEDE